MVHSLVICPNILQNQALIIGFTDIRIATLIVRLEKQKLFAINLDMYSMGNILIMDL